MSSLICEQDIYITDNSKKRLITALRSAINAAEQDEDEVSINFDNLEITWNFPASEFFVIG